jgi:hypothetical protein
LQAAPAEEPKKRKAPRLPLEFAVAVRYESANGEMVRTTCKTASVCVNGALVAMNGAVDLGQSLQLTNVKTSQEVDCVVRSVRHKEKENITLVGVEFAEWTPEFWEILFPRQEGDPEPSPQSGRGRAAKPFFGRARTLPGNAANEAGAEQAAGDGAVGQAEGPSNLAAPMWRNKKALAGAAAALVLAIVWAALRPAGQAGPGSEAESAASFVLPAEVAKVVPNPAGFRLARSGDFAPEASGFLRSMGQDATGEINGKFGGEGQSLAYVMLRSDKSWRIAVAVDGQIRCDAQYQQVAIAGRIPLSVVRRIKWSSPPSTEPEADGLLVVRSAGQANSAVVLFVQGTEVISGTPADYTEIPALMAP